MKLFSKVSILVSFGTNDVFIDPLISVKPQLSLCNCRFKKFSFLKCHKCLCHFCLPEHRREKTRLEQLQQEQKIIEERNKRTKALLAKTIAEK